MSLNLHRRHLDESQRSMVAAKIANMRQGARTDLEPSANLPEVSQAEAADLLNVSERSTRSAKKVLDEGSLILVSKVESGEVAVSTAADLVDLGKEEQEDVLKGGEAAVLKAAKDIKRKRAKRRVEERTARQFVSNSVSRKPIAVRPLPELRSCAESPERRRERRTPPAI